MTDVIKHDAPTLLPRLTLPVPEWLRSFDLPADWFDRDGMRVEEFREGSTQVVRAEMPGIDPEKDVDISMKDGVLTIRASRRETHEERSEETGSFRSEFRYGHFTRRLALPAGATEKDVKATYSDGILEVRVPIDGDAENETKIEVSRG